MTPFALKKGVFFDLDGTLVNTLQDIAGNVNHTRTHYKLNPLNINDIQSSIGRGIEHLIKSCFQEFEESYHADIQQVLTLYLEKSSFQGGAVYSGISKILSQLNERKIPIAVVTNKPTAAAIKTIQYYLPEIQFHLIWGPDKVSAKKPDPRHLLEAISACKLSPETSLFIGDDEVDFLTAQAAKVDFLGAGWGFGNVATTSAKVLTKVSFLSHFLALG